MNIQVSKEKVQEIISKSIPIFNNALSEKDWNKVINNYLKRVNAIPSECNDVIKSSCLIDLIICSLDDSENAIANKETIKGINTEIDKALAYCDKHTFLLNKVKDLIRKSILEMDTNIATRNSAFKNWVNELYVFNLLAEWNDYEVVDVERPLGNGKTCDFVCRNNKGEEIGFEVLTIQGIDPSKQDDSTTMNEFINERIMIKFKDKTEGILHENIPNIRILPVIEYVDGLEQFNITLNNDRATEPFAVMKNNIDGLVQTELRPLNTFLAHIRTHQEVV